MSETKKSTVIACRVSLEAANDAYKFARDHDTTVGDILKLGLTLAKEVIISDGPAVLTALKGRCD